MTETDRSLIRLLTWLSPSFPVGAFAYSHGLEQAVEDGQVSGAEDLRTWLSHLVTSGSAWNDAVVLAEAWRQGSGQVDLREIADLAEALAGSRERHLESTGQGAAFIAAVKAWTCGASMRLPANVPYGVAVGGVAGALGVNLRQVLIAILHAFVQNQTQAAIRLGLVGQIGGLDVLAKLEAIVLAAAERAANSTLDDLGSSSFLPEIAAMRHETQHSRIFRS